MNALTIDERDSSTLPQLVEKAAAALANARSAAEVLEAREIASLAYDVAKRTARLCKAKNAHDELIAAAHRVQADALTIEAGAKRRLADEYDMAQAQGDVGQQGARTDLVRDANDVAATAADLGLNRREIHEARLLRDAEAADPGLVRRTLDGRIERGEEPARAALRRAAEARLERSIDRLRRTQESVQRLEAEKASPLSPEERAHQVAVFGTLEDRAICARIDEIVELIGEQPDAAEAVRRIPPASRHAIDTVPIRRAAAWLTGFSTLYEQEAHHGDHASE
jgi:hypothetical protein